MPFTTAELNKMLELSNEATPGPWTVDAGENKNDAAIDARRGDDRLGFSSWHEMISVHGAEDNPTVGNRVADANAFFIVMARTAVPSLVEEVFRLRKLLKEAGIDE